MLTAFILSKRMGLETIRLYVDQNNFFYVLTASQLFKY